MNFLQSILIIAVFIPAIISSRRSSTHEFTRRLQQFILQSRAEVKLSTECNWFTYDLAVTSKYRGNDYQCPKQTTVSGYCILPWSDAVTLCNSDPECEGFVMTTVHEWHVSYDTNKEPAVHLYKSPKVNSAANSKWYIFNKNCWKFDA